MKNSLKDLGVTYTDFLMGRIPEKYREDFKKERMNTNVNRTLGLTIYTIVVQVILFIIMNALERSRVYDDLTRITKLSMVSLLICIIHFFLCLLIKRKVIKNERLKGLLPYTFTYLYSIVHILSFYASLSLVGDIDFYILALIVIVFFIIAPPIQSIVSIVIVFTVSTLLVYGSQASNDVWSLAITTDMFFNVIRITLLCLYVSILIYFMYLKSYLIGKALEEMNLKNELASKKDTLTELYNRRGFFDGLNQFLENEKNQRIISVAMFDIDYFKQYNDQHGHVEGDYCLQQVASALSDGFDGCDSILCRYGGEEFLAILYTQTEEEAYQLVEATRKRVKALGMISEVHGAKRNVTISVGLACVPVEKQIDIDQFISHADVALYKAKGDGRDQVCISDYLK